MTHTLTDARAPYRAGLALTGESVAVEADAEGVALTSEALFTDGWLVLPWDDVAALVLMLKAALSWHAHDGPSDARRRPCSLLTAESCGILPEAPKSPQNAPDEASR